MTAVAPARPEEIRIKVVASPSEGRLFGDRADDGRRVVVDVGLVADRPETHVLRIPGHAPWRVAASP